MSGMMIRTLPAWGIGIALAAVAAGCGGSVEPPAAYADFTSKTGAFSCKLPEGWKVEGGGKSDGSSDWAEASKGRFKIRITTSIAGSAIGEMANLGNSGGLDNESEHPTARVHEFHYDRFKENYNDYKEGDPQKFQGKMGEGRVSHFSAASGGMGPKLHGYRATFWNNKLSTTVMAECPENQWPKFKPVFEEVIASVKK